MKKIISNILAVFLTLCISLSLVGCKEEPIPEGPIPNGRYVHSEKNAQFLDTYVYTEDDDVEFYWKIEGNKAESWGSGDVGIKAEIVEKDGVIYFEGYKWDDPLYNLGMLLRGEEPGMIGCTNIYVVEYNEQEKSLIVELYKRGDKLWEQK